MAVITIKRKINFPLFNARKWRKADHDRPLRFQLAIAKAFIYFEEKRPYEKDWIGFPSGRIELVYDPAPESILKGLNSNGNLTIEVAQMIYDAYLEINKKFDALLYSVGKVRSLPPTTPISITDFFGDRTNLRRSVVEWKIDNGIFNPFIPKLPKPKDRNPLFKAEQIITPARWAALQKAADAGDFPDGEVLELYRIRSKASWQQIRIAAIEASIISESLLRSYGLKILKKNGFSNTKIKNLKDELTFNNLLNIVLPLSISKTELRSMHPRIDSVDKLRRIRNDLIHGNIEEKVVDLKIVDEGIDAAIRLVRFLRGKIS